MHFEGARPLARVLARHVAAGLARVLPQPGGGGRRWTLGRGLATEGVFEARNDKINF